MRLKNNGSVLIGVAVGGTALILLGMTLVQSMRGKIDLFSKRSQAQSKRSTAEASLRAMLSDRTALILTRQFPANAVLNTCLTSGASCPTVLTDFTLLDDTGAVLIPAGVAANFDDFGKPCPTSGQLNPATGAVCRWQLRAQYVAHPFTPPGFPAQPGEAVCGASTCIDVYFSGRAVVDATVDVKNQVAIADFNVLVRGVHRSLFFPDAKYAAINCAARTDCAIYDSTGATYLGTGQCDYLQGFDPSTGDPVCAAKRKGVKGIDGLAGVDAVPGPGASIIDWTYNYPPPCDTIADVKAGGSAITLKIGSNVGCDVCGLVTLFDCDASASQKIADKRRIPCNGANDPRFGCPPGFTLQPSCWIKAANASKVRFSGCGDGDDYSAVCVRNGFTLPAGTAYTKTVQPTDCLKATAASVGKAGICYVTRDCTGAPVATCTGAGCTEPVCASQGGHSLKPGTGSGSKCVDFDDPDDP